MIQSSQSPTISINRTLENDEVDLIQLIKLVLSTWRPWVLSLALVTIAYIVYLTLQTLLVTNEATYSKPIRFTFPDSHRLVFPSGAKFSYGDIVAPAVVQVAYERNKLADYGLSIADLQGGLSSIPYAPTYPFIIRRYEKIMNDKKLTADQLEALQKQMDEEIDQATSGEALISLRLNKKQIPDEIVNKLLSDIPAIWAERAMREKGVLGINVQLSSINSINTELILKVDGIIAGDLLSEKLALLKRNISAMAAFEGVQSVTDPKTGMKLMDLSFAIDDLGNYVIADLFAPLRLAGLSRNIPSATYYYEDKINRLKISLLALQRQSDQLQGIYNSYVQHDSGALYSGADAKAGSSIVMPQLSSDMLDKLVRLSGDTEREKYKQELNEKRIQLTKSIADSESQIADAQLILSALQKSHLNGGKLSADNERYLKEVDENLPMILTKVTEFFGVSDRIYKQLSIESVGIRDQLYIPLTNTVLARKDLMDVRSSLMIWLSLLILTTVIVVPSVMLRKAMLKRELTKAH